ncbi:DMT family transporter [Aquabacterium sp. A08]|uniref:DMT family transporter n=1 Tax=Aquabacterium sp. A08 TaxID=2718532 RepID=UPI001420D00D|nr:DMT family transporter [Aquabacterium sp. A08]NIC41399.1 DMT family transporter [Aquabacterium sp. A08]NIC41446.1 DMT family transporter [Aquabacterium sp. A08]
MTAPPRAPGNLRSITAMVVAVGFFALMDTVLKLLAAHYPALQVAALRGLVALPLVFVYLSWRGAWGRVWRLRWPLHLLRGVLSVGMLGLFTYGVRGLPLTNAYTLFFVAPLLITLLAVGFLGERVPRTHGWAVAVGLLGVLVALRPSPDAFLGWAGLAVLGAAACYAASAVAGRLLCRTDAPESLVLWSMLLLALFAGVLALPGWVPLRAEDAGLLLALALTGFGGQLAITEAFRHGQASAVAPFEYTALAWGVGLDWLLWYTLPDGYTLLGAAIIVASGLYLVRHERIHAQAEVHTSVDHP